MTQSPPLEATIAAVKGKKLTEKEPKAISLLAKSRQIVEECRIDPDLNA